MFTGYDGVLGQREDAKEVWTLVVLEEEQRDTGINTVTETSSSPDVDTFE